MAANKPAQAQNVVIRPNDILSLAPALKMLMPGLEDIFKSGQFYDVTVKSGECEWNLHRIILCAQSRYFQNLLAGQFMEANQESVELQEDRPDILHTMFNFMYTAKMQLPPGCVDPQPILCIHLYMTAKKYDVPRLVDRARARFQQVCNPHMLSELLQCIEILDTVTGGTTELWDIIIQKIEPMASVLLSAQDFQQKLTESGELSRRLMAALAARPSIEPADASTAPEKKPKVNSSGQQRGGRASRG